MKLIMAILLIFSAHPVWAYTGGQEGNGGDICEDRFKGVRDDINSWILAGGANGLLFPPSVTLTQYTTGMLQAISTASISCTDDQLLIGTVEKTCKNFKNADGSLSIVCNNQRFLETAESDQYVLVHHEYAGLAGFEVNDGSDSVYTISNQISEYLQDETVKKLGVKPVLSSSDPFNPASCLGPEISQQEALSHFSPGTDTSNAIGSSAFFQRFRACNTLTGCQNWQTRVPSFVYLVNDHYNHVFYAQDTLPTLTGNGAIIFAIINGAVQLQFPSASDSNDLFKGSCGSVSDTQMSCQNIAFGPDYVLYSADDLFANIAYQAGPALALTGVVTNHCLRLDSTYQGLVSSSGDYHDVETVWYGQF